MSQAEALLNNLASEETTVYTRNSETEGHIVIGNDRFITVPDSLKRIAVQYDHNIETVTFDCPRYWDNHDMSQMKVYINYILPNNKVGSYLAQNVTPLGNTMTFTWTISGNVTQGKGDISFLVCAKRTDDEGNETLHWNSELNSDCYISEGLAVNNSIVSKYPDIITQLLTRMDEVEAIATIEAMQSYTDTWLEANHDRVLAEIEAKGAATLATIPEDYTTTYNAATEAVRTKSDAIVCEADGETIVLNDSSDDYVRGLKVFGKSTQVTTTGKNLLKINTWTQGGAGVTFTVNADTTITVNGTATDIAYIPIEVTLDPNTEYILSGCPNGGSSTSYSAYMIDKSTFSKMYHDYGSSVTFNTGSETKWEARIRVAPGTILSNKVFRLMIRLATVEDSSWEPYTGGKPAPSPEYPQELVSVSPTVNALTSNLLDTSALDRRTCTSITVSEDGYTISLTGGTYGAYVSARYTIGEDIVSGIRGKRVTFKADSIESTQPDAFPGPQITLFEGYEPVMYYTLTENSLKTSFIVPETTTKIELGAYVNNTPRTLETDNHVVIKGVTMHIGEHDWEPYSTQSSKPNAILRGIPVPSGGNYTDSDGQQWVCDEIDFNRGVYIQRILDLALTGNETVSRETTSTWAEGCYVVYTKAKNPEHVHGEIMCSFLPTHSNADLADGKFTCGIGTHGQPNLMVKFSDETNTLELFKTAWAKVIGDGGKVYVILATPIETPLTAEEIAAFKALRTNYPNTTILNDAGAHMSVKYNADTKLYVDNKISAAISAFLAEHQIG